MSKSTHTSTSCFDGQSHDGNDASVTDLIKNIDLFLQSLRQSENQQCHTSPTVTAIPSSSSAMVYNVSDLTSASDHDSQFHFDNACFSLNDFQIKADYESQLPFSCDQKLNSFSVSQATVVSNSEDDIADKKECLLNQIQKQTCKEIDNAPKEHEMKKRGPSRNCTSFPNILYYLLEQADLNGFQHIVSWKSHGRAFRVHDQAKFVALVMPCFFQQTRFPSFQRQLALYGFTRLTKKGEDFGAYYHEKFLRGQPQLCNRIQRTPVKGGMFNKLPYPNIEPDFYSMPPSEFSHREASLETPLAKLFHIGNAMNAAPLNEEYFPRHAQHWPNQESNSVKSTETNQLSAPIISSMSTALFTEGNRNQHSNQEVMQQSLLSSSIVFL